MTRALRARHRRIVPLLAAGLPLLVAAALAARPDDPRGELPASLRAALPAPAEPAWSASFAGQALTVRAAAGRGDGAAPATGSARSGSDVVVEIAARSELGQPELLAYWAPSAPDGDALPGGAVLLGAVSVGSPQRLRLPAVALRRPGHLVVYDLLHGESAAHVAMPAIAGDADAASDGGAR